MPAPLEGVAPRAAVLVGGGAAAKAICASCQVRDHCLDLAVKAAAGLDQDHGVFGGTLPAERSRLRGNTFPEPSVLRQRRELAEQAHQLASQVGLRQAARQLGVHRDALTAAFTHWELPMPACLAPGGSRPLCKALVEPRRITPPTALALLRRSMVRCS